MPCETIKSKAIFIEFTCFTSYVASIYKLNSSSILSLYFILLFYLFLVQHVPGLNSFISVCVLWLTLVMFFKYCLTTYLFFVNLFNILMPQQLN